VAASPTRSTDVLIAVEIEKEGSGARNWKGLSRQTQNICFSLLISLQFVLHTLMAGVLIGEAERRYIVAGAEAGVRGDGRAREDLRRLDIQLDVIPNATGSARVRLGGTDVIVAVKAEIGEPDSRRPDAGLLKFHCECSPVASPAFRGRGGEELGSEIARALDRCMFAPPHASAAAPLDLGALKIVAGKTCWVLFIDALILDLDGAALDAVSVAAKAALHDAKIPQVSVVQGESPDEDPEYEVDDDPNAATRLDVAAVPLALSVCQLGAAAAVDPTADEEEAAAAALQVAVDAQGTVCGITKRGEAAVEPVMMMVRAGRGFFLHEKSCRTELKRGSISFLRF
jgi:exosome complex component RRP42